MEETADHRAHRQGDEGRPGEMSRRGRQRLHRKAFGYRTAPVARARMDAEVDKQSAAAGRKFDIEFRLLIDAIYHVYHYDFRGYAPASLRRRLRSAMTRFH